MITADQAGVALARLGEYNLEDYDATGNPRGLGNDGHAENLEPLLGDMATVGQYAGERAAAAAQGAADAGVARDAVLAVQSAVTEAGGVTVAATTALRDQARAARDQAALYAASTAAAVTDVTERVGTPPCLDLLLSDPAAVPSSWFTRASTGTILRSSGRLGTAAVNALRIDHDGTTGALLGAAVNGVTTNLLLRSADFTSVWAVFGGTMAITADSTLAPDGTTSADTLNDTDAAAAPFVYQNVTVPNDTTTYTYSVYLRAGSAAKTQLRLTFQGGAVINALAEVTWATSTVSASGGTAAMESVGNGWYRVALTAANGGGNSVAQCQVSASTSSNAATGTVIAWGAQMEVGPFATAYIPTTALIASRAADLLTIPLADLPDWRGDEWTLYIEWALAGIRGPNDAQCLFSVSDGTLNNYVQMFATSYSTTLGEFSINTAAALQAFMQPPAPAAAVTHRTAVRVKTNDVAHVRSAGGVVGPLTVDGTVTLPGGLTQLCIGHRQGTFALRGWVPRVALWPRALPDATLTALVTP